MIVRWSRPAAVLGLAVVFLGLCAYGQDVSMKYLSPVNSSVIWDNAYYAGIYNGQINGASAQMICDDFQDQISANQTWNATALNVSSLANLSSTDLSSKTMFGGTIGLSGYAQVAYLVSQIFAYGSGGAGNQANINLTVGGVPVNNLTLANLSAVVWALTDSALSGQLSSKETSLLNAVHNLYTNTNSAKAYLSGLTNLWLYTPNPNNGPGQSGGQEMWSQLGMPEGGEALLYLLLAGGICFGAMFFKSRNAIRI